MRVTRVFAKTKKSWYRDLELTWISLSFLPSGPCMHALYPLPNRVPSPSPYPHQTFDRYGNAWPCGTVEWGALEAFWRLEGFEASRVLYTHNIQYYSLQTVNNRHNVNLPEIKAAGKIIRYILEALDKIRERRFILCKV